MASGEERNGGDMLGMDGATGDDDMIGVPGKTPVLHEPCSLELGAPIDELPLPGRVPCTVGCAPGTVDVPCVHVPCIGVTDISSTPSETQSPRWTRG
jgi:hypothetical protein